MNKDVVILDCKIILNPDFGDQPKMINKLSYHWVGVAFTSLKIQPHVLQTKTKHSFIIEAEGDLSYTVLKFLIMAPTNYANKGLVKRKFG